MSEKAPKNPRAELVALTGEDYRKVYEMSNADVEAALYKAKDLSGIVTIGKTGRAHGDDGKFLPLSNENINQIRANKDLIHAHRNTNRYDTATATVPATLRTGQFRIPEPSPATTPWSVESFQAGQAKWLENALEPVESNRPSITTRKGKFSRFHEKFSNFRNRGSDLAATALIKTGLAKPIVKAAQYTGLIMSGASSALTKEKRLAKAKAHRREGHRVRALSLETKALLGSAVMALIALKALRPAGAEAADVLDLPQFQGSGIDLQDLADKANDGEHDYHFFDEGKESAHAFGKPLDQESKEASVKDLQGRYNEDPTLLAAHAAKFDPKFSDGDINRLANDLDRDAAFREKTVDRLLKLQEHYDVRVEEIDQNYKSQYMTLGPDGKPNVFYDDLVENRGTMLVFTNKETGEEYKVRIHCGGQIIQEHAFQGVPSAEDLGIIPEQTNTTSRRRFRDLFRRGEGESHTETVENRTEQDTTQVVTEVTDETTTTTETPGEEEVTVVPPEEGETPVTPEPPEPPEPPQPPEPPEPPQPPQENDDKRPGEAPPNHDNGNNLAPKPERKPDTNLDGVTPGKPENPQPEVGKPAPQVPDQAEAPRPPATVEPVVPAAPARPNTSSPEGAGGNPAIPTGDGEGTTNNGTPSTNPKPDEV